MKFRNAVVSSSKELLAHLHYYVSVAANHVYKTGLQLWDLAGELEWPLMGEIRPVGRAVMLGAMIVNFAGGHALLKLYGLSYLVLLRPLELHLLELFPRKAMEAAEGPKCPGKEADDSERGYGTAD